jgi:trigger factor
MENSQKQDTDFKIPVKLADYKGIKVKKNELRVEKAEIDNSLDYLRKSRAKTITVNRPAEKGNRVEIDFEVRHGEVKIENGTSNNHPLILGEGRFLPGFEKELEGMSAGEEKNFSLKAPKDWPDKRVAEKNLDFKVKMKLVQERQIPELNDEFAKSLGNFMSVDALKQNVSGGILEEKEMKEKQRIKIELIEKVTENSKMEIPENLITEELEKMINEFKFSITGFGMDFDKYLQEIKKTIPELKKEWKNQAEKRVRIAVCLKAIAEKEDIEVSDEEIENKINEELKNYPNIEEVKKNIDLKALRVYTEEVLRNEKVLGLLEKEAKIV